MGRRGGSKPGERRGGRKKGTPNKGNAEIREFAQQFGEEAIRALVAIARNGRADYRTRANAWSEILDRGYGRPAQAITGADGGPLEFKRIECVIVDPADRVR